jgi:hypothetical protein
MHKARHRPARRRPGAAFAGFFDGEAALGRRPFLLWCALACVLALLLRLPALASRSLSLDETYSAWFAALPLAELWTRVPLYETHPPLYYTLLKAWQALAGSGEAGLRSLSVLASVATVLVVALAARVARLGPRAERVGLLGALFLALNAGHIQYAQQARPYALQTLAASLAVFCSCMLLARLRRGQAPWGWAGALAGAAGATLWLHNTSMFIALGIWSGMVVSLLCLVPGRRREQALAVGLAGLLALLLWLPFLPTLLKASAGLARLAFWHPFHPHDLFAAWVLAAGGSALKWPAGLLGLAALAWLWHRRRGWLACHVVLVLGTAPLALAAYSWAVKPVFIPRLFEWQAPLVMALLALGVFALPARSRAPVAGLVVALSAAAIGALYASPAENWREMLAQVGAGAREGDLILGMPNEIQIPAQYYLKPGAAPVRYLPAPFPALDLARRYPSNLGAPPVAPADITRLRALLPSYRRVWLVERHADLYDPGRIVAAELARRYRPVLAIHGNGALITLFEAGVQAHAAAAPGRR